jgi:prophage antirepressor-like protein
MNTAIEKMFTYEGRVVRVELFDGEPWWAAKDVAEVLGYSETTISTSLSNLAEKVPEEWRCRKPFLTPGGVQEIIALSEPGLYFFLARSDKPAALPFQKWIAGEVIPSIRKTGTYGIQKTNIELLLESVQALADQEKKLIRLDQRVENIEKRSTEATVSLYSVPNPSGTPVERSIASFINEVVRSYAIANRCPYLDVYAKLYREFRDRYHIDLMARKRMSVKKYKSIMHLAEAEFPDRLQDLYDVAYELFATF